MTSPPRAGRIVRVLYSPPETAARAAHDILTAVAADGRVDTSRTEQAVGHGERPISSDTSAHAAA